MPVYNRVGDNKKKIFALSIYSIIQQKWIERLSNPHTLETVNQNNETLTEKKRCGVITVIRVKGRDGILLRSFSKALRDGKLPSAL